MANVIIQDLTPSSDPIVYELWGDVIIGGRKLSLSKAVRAGDYVFLTGQIPFEDGAPMTTGTIEDQTRVTLDLIGETLAEAGCARSETW